jgi:integrase
VPKPLTAIAIAALKAKPRRFEVSDGGCHGLRIVVFPSRRKSFIVRYRYRGLQRKLTLGPVLVERGVVETDSAPELDTPLSLAAARELATKALREAKSGRDPAAEKQRARQEERAAESDTLAAIAAEYLRREGPRLRTFNQRRSDLALLTDGVLGRQPVAGITRGQYTRVLDHIADNNGPGRADRCLSALRTLLNWHAGRSDFISPLVRGMRRTSTKERARERVLDDSELRAVWMAAQQDDGPFGAFIRFTLLTATRRGESAGLKRDELSADGTTWTIPARRYKSNRDMLIPLSEAARRIIAAMPDRGGFIFSATGERPLGNFNERKNLLDAASGVNGWRLHDLRRTARTLLSRAGISADHAERCLGHALGAIRGTYDRFQYFDEKLRAFEALAGLVERIVDPPAGVVVPMPAKGARK